MSSNQERSPDYGLLVLADAEALRDHLDALNEAGTDDRAAGMDARGEPFLIVPRIAVENYLGPVPQSTSLSCVECMAQRPHRLDSLRFPVRILTRVTPTGSGDTP